MLTRDTPEGRVKAIGFCEQALGVIEEHNNNSQVAYMLDAPISVIYDSNHIPASLFVCLL
jgi:hypothetical protein